MMLGASKAQVPGIIAAKNLGHQVVTCDYLSDAPGHLLADQQLFISTFHEQEVLEAARKLKIEGIMTMGTDQPVYTAAYVAEALSLPSLLSKETALRVTNKEEMKKVFDAFHIPCASSILYKKGENDDALQMIKYPVVVKPVDSQGQRGVYFLEDAEAVRNHYELVVQHSRKQYILVEKYYPHQEITVSGWVVDGKPQVLTITDRVTFTDKNHIGICLSHEYPSKFCCEEWMKPIDKQASIHRYKHPDKASIKYKSENINERKRIETLTQQLVQAFQIENGPIYFQYFMGAEGLKVNEVACRIGGAYESSFIPMATGVDICRLHVQATLGKRIEYADLFSLQENQRTQEMDLFCSEDRHIDRHVEEQAHLDEHLDKHTYISLSKSNYADEANYLTYSEANHIKQDRHLLVSKKNHVTNLSVQLFFAEPCKIAYMPTEEKLLGIEGVVEAGLFKKTGQIISNIDNATSRVGYAIVIGNSVKQVEDRLDNLYQVLRIEDDKGINHIIHRTVKHLS